MVDSFEVGSSEEKLGHRGLAFKQALVYQLFLPSVSQPFGNEQTSPIMHVLAVVVSK